MDKVNSKSYKIHPCEKKKVKEEMAQIGLWPRKSFVILSNGCVGML